jgi:acyl carrier protein
VISNTQHLTLITLRIASNLKQPVSRCIGPGRSDPPTSGNEVLFTLNLKTTREGEENSMEDQIKQQILNFIIENFLYGESHGLSESDSLLEERVIDSTGVLELVGFIEETYGIKVEDDELTPENLDSIVNVTDFIVRKQAQLVTV